jgi:ADP-ribose pyrophosphatase YjhB (NUDIX family)
MLAEEVNYCPRCGSSLAQEERFGQVRPVCPRCGWIYFADPKVAAAVLVERDGEVLLVRRTNEPQRGMWTIPAGFVDAGEDPATAAVRECLEETGLMVRVTRLLDVIFGLEHPRGAHIVIAYAGEVVSGDLQPGDDADGAAFFPPEALPPIAFQATRRILEMAHAE